MSTAQKALRQSSAPTLLLVLAERLHIALSDKFPHEGFRVEHREYRIVELGEWHGFYDWLRADREEIIGIRYWPFADDPVGTAGMPDRSYIMKDPKNRFLDIFFGLQRSFQEEISEDRDFGPHAAFHTLSGGFALAFDASMLSEKEVDSLRAVSVDWINR